MEFNIDFSTISALEMKRLNISFEEIRSIFSNPSSFHEPFEDFNYLIGFGSNRKFIQVAYRISKNINFEVEVLEIDLPYEKDIKEHWCKSNQR
jgi:hypothetical protein